MRELSVQAMFVSRAVWELWSDVAVLVVPAYSVLHEICA